MTDHNQYYQDLLAYEDETLKRSHETIEKGRGVLPADDVPSLPLARVKDAIADLSTVNWSAPIAGLPAEIRVLYDYPFKASGPSTEEAQHRGWIFTEKALDGKAFTRGGLIRAISARYTAMYAVEDDTSSRKATTIPGMYNRALSDGKYKIYGHVLEDLYLDGVFICPGETFYRLVISS